MKHPLQVRPRNKLPRSRRSHTDPVRRHMSIYLDCGESWFPFQWWRREQHEAAGRDPWRASRYGTERWFWLPLHRVHAYKRTFGRPRR